MPTARAIRLSGAGNQSLGYALNVKRLGAGQGSNNEGERDWHHHNGYYPYRERANEMFGSGE